MKDFSSFLASLCTILLAFSSLSAQLPHQMTEEEIPLMSIYQAEGSLQGIPVPPDFEVRTPAEWEEADAIMITWTQFTSVLREIVRHAQDAAEVIIIADSPTQVASYLSQGGVTMNNVTVLTENFNSIWCRDYGQWSIYREDVGELNLVDFIYNRPRPADDAVPQAIADFFDLEMYETTEAPYDLIHTGGNFMTDGLGTGFSSTLITEENPGKTEAEIDGIMNEFMGIERYIKMQTLPYDEIHHIDMHMKLIDEETMVVSQYPPAIADGPQIEANIEMVVANYNSYFGGEYEIVWLPAPADANGDYPNQGGDYRTYTNAIFVNTTLLVPIYDTETDEEALNIYRDLLPAYNVVGIDCNQIIPALGALHCITKLVHSDDPLLIVHQKLKESFDEPGYQVEARIQHASGIDAATTYYKVDTASSFSSVDMTLIDASNNMWAADIPLHFNGTQLDYYIEAEAVSGKQQVRPMTAPEGFYSFEINNEFIDSTDLASGVQDLFFTENSFSMSPNPVQESAIVTADFLEVSNIKIALTDLEGREVARLFEGPIQTGLQSFNWNRNDLPSGMYLLSIQSNQQMMAKKVLLD